MAAVGSPSRNYDPLLGMEEPPVERPSYWQRFKPFLGLASGVGLAVTSIAVLVFNTDPDPGTRVVSYMAGGVGLQTAFDSLAPPKLRHIVHKVLDNVATQPTLFATTQLYFDVEGAQKASVNTILALGGASIRRMVTRGVEKGGVALVESSVPKEGNNLTTFQKIFPARYATMTLSAAGAVGCGLAWKLSSDAIVRAFASFFGPFFATGIAGTAAATWVHHKVRVADLLAADEDVVGTRWRLVRVVMDTAGTLVPLCLLIPLDGAGCSATSGGLIGFLDSVAKAGQTERFQQVPIEELNELDPPPDLPLKNLAYRCFEVAWPALALTSLTGFVIWQEGWQLTDAAQRRDLGLLFGSTVLSFASAVGIERLWNKQERIQIRPDQLSLARRLHDRALCTLLLKPRIPLLVSFVGMNAISLNSSALASDTQASYQVAAAAGWGGYGVAMGIEAARANGWMEGMPFECQEMFWVNVLQTAKHVIQGNV